MISLVNVFHIDINISGRTQKAFVVGHIGLNDGDGVFALYTTKHYKQTLFHLCKGDDGSWEEVMTFDSHWILAIIQCLLIGIDYIGLRPLPDVGQIETKEIYDALHAAGCKDEIPLLGYRPRVGPRCRLCNTTIRIENQWQPIEIAPKDGTEILLWYENDGCMDIGYYTEKQTGEPFWVSNLSETFVDVVPTHWMPLPEKPK